jgi:hypothetical protein
MDASRPFTRRESFGAALAYATVNVLAARHGEHAPAWFAVFSLTAAVLALVVYLASWPRPFTRSALALFVLSMLALALANVGIWGRRVAGA